jgi:GGDEF domain-containing protein
VTEIFEDYYRTLQVRHDASPEVVEAAYRRLCKLYHPDLNHSGHATERMKAINRAYEVLGDAARRSHYEDAWVSAQSQQGVLREPPVSDDPAQAALEEYLQDLMDGRWDSAYLKLSAADHRTVPPEDFRLWQSQVARLYRMGAFALRLFRRLFNCEMEGHVYAQVREFHVYVNEIDLRTERLCEDNFTKHVALENGVWRVCLGFSDLKPAIERLRYLQDHAAAVDAERVYNEAILHHDAPTGLLSRAGFLEQAEREAVRSRRYGNPFAVAVFQLQGAVDEVVLSRSAAQLRAHVRQTDVAGRWGECSLAVLFTETLESGACIACAKLAECLAQAGASAYWGVAAYDGFSAEDTAMAAEEQARRVGPAHR